MLSEHISLSNSCYPHAVLGWIDKQNKKRRRESSLSYQPLCSAPFWLLGRGADINRFATTAEEASVCNSSSLAQHPWSKNVNNKKPRNEKRRNKKVGKQNNTRKSHRVYFSRRERDFWWRRECKSKRRKKRAKRKGSRGSFKKGKKPDTVSPFFFTTAAATSFSPPFSVCVCVCWCWW